MKLEIPLITLRKKAVGYSRPLEVEMVLTNNLQYGTRTKISQHVPIIFADLTNNSPRLQLSMSCTTQGFRHFAECSRFRDGRVCWKPERITDEKLGNSTST